MSYRFVIWGHPFASRLFSTRLMMKNIGKTRLSMTDWCYQSEYSPNGVIQRLLVKLWTSWIGQCAQICTGAQPWPSKWPAKLVHFSLLFCLLLPWRPPGQYRASSHPMVTSSCFQCSMGMDMLHWAMLSVLHHHTPMAIEMACNGGTFARYRHLFPWHY